MARKKKTSDTLAFSNAAKTLLANIRFASVDTPIKSITLTSSIPNEGKSTIALNLAKAIATSGKSVLLVECDMRHRTLANMLGVRHAGGLYAVLSDQMSIDEAVIDTGQPNLFFLDAEPRIPNPADIIASRRFAKLVAALEETSTSSLILRLWVRLSTLPKSLRSPTAPSISSVRTLPSAMRSSLPSISSTRPRST